MALRFAGCELDEEARQLRRGGKPQSLSPKAFQLLQLLVQARPRAISKQELHDKLWPDTFVGPTSLGRTISELRAALGDDRESQEVVRTVHGYGYAFAADVEGDTDVPTPAFGLGALSRVLVWSGHVVPLEDGESVIGRGGDCTVRVPMHGVSRHHARIRIEGPQAVIEDLGSKNGTFVRQRRIEGQAVLHDGDEIRLGVAVLVYCAPAAAPTAEPATGRHAKR
jgi:DNA-binding winged helix-turn-helix (wHTH) protein